MCREAKSLMNLHGGAEIFRISDPSLQPHKEVLFPSVNRGKILHGASGMDMISKNFSFISGALQRIYLSLYTWKGNPVWWFMKLQLPSQNPTRYFKHSFVPSACILPCWLPNWLSEEGGREDCNGSQVTVGHLTTSHECELFAKGPKCRHMTAGCGGDSSTTFYNSFKHFLSRKTSFLRLL